MPGPYTLVGSGIQSLGNPGSLHVHIGQKPASYGLGGANPPNYFNIGLLRLGSGNGYMPPISVEADDMWVACPQGTTLLGYELAVGAQIVVTELAGFPWSGPPPPLEQLTDVAISGVADAQVLSWNAASSRWVNSTPVGGAAALSHSSAFLSADVSILAANSYTDGPSLTLAAGTWLLIGCVSISANVACTLTCQLTDGATVAASANTYNSQGYPQLTIAGIAVLAGSATWRISAACNTVSATVMKAASPFNAVGNNATWLQAIRIG